MDKLDAMPGIRPGRGKEGASPLFPGNWESVNPRSANRFPPWKRSSVPN